MPPQPIKTRLAREYRDKDGAEITCRELNLNDKIVTTFSTGCL